MHSVEIAPQFVQWKRKYGGGPSVALASIETVMPEDNETRMIKKQQLSHFVSNRAFWTPFVEDLVKLFSA